MSGHPFRSAAALSAITATGLLAGCSFAPPGSWPVARNPYRPPPYLYTNFYDPPPADDPPAILVPTQDGAWNNWGSDLALGAGAGAGIEAGKFALSKLRGARAAGAAAGEVPAIVRAAPKVAPLVEGGAEGDAIIAGIERTFIWLAEHPYMLLLE